MTGILLPVAKNCIGSTAVERQNVTERLDVSDEFTRAGRNTVNSSEGFTVEARFAEIFYDDAIGHVVLYAEWGGTPSAVLLSKASLDRIDAHRAGIVLANVTRALNYLGHRVTVRSDI